MTQLQQTQQSTEEEQMKRYVEMLDRAADEKSPYNRIESRISFLKHLRDNLISESEMQGQGRTIEGKVVAHAGAIVEKDLAQLLEQEGFSEIVPFHYLSAGNGFYLAGDYNSALEMYEEARRTKLNFGDVDVLINETRNKLKAQAQ